MSDALAELLARLETAAPKPIAVPVPGVGMMFVLPLTVADMDETQAAAMKAETRPEQIARGVARILCDADGKRFATVEPDGTPSAQYEALVKLIMRLPWEHSQQLMQAATGAADAGNA